MEEEIRADNEEMVASQESPSVEEPAESNDFDTAEKLEQTPKSDEQAERNWKAMREEFELLKAENQRLKQGNIAPKDPVIDDTFSRIYLDSNENIALGRNELKAELKYPELENTNNPFSMAVAGKYRTELDKYIQSKMRGVEASLPSKYEIAMQLKTTWDKTFGNIIRKSEVEGAKKAKEAVASKEATIDAEASGVRAKVAKSAEEISALKYRSRQGGNTGIDAIAERLSRSGL